MRISKKTSIIGASALALALLSGAAAISATAAVQANGSDGPLYIFSGNDGSEQDAPGHVYAWNDSIIASADAVNPESELACPVESTLAYTFTTAPGTERTGTDGWGAFSVNALTATGGVNIANIGTENQINGVPGQAALRAAGGTYSLGVACTIDNGVNVVAAYYRTINVTAGTGAFTVQRNSDAVVTPPTDPSMTGTVDLAPTTLSAVEGELSLVVPANAAASFGAPTLIDNKSTTTGTLGQITVDDQRFNTRQGWTLSADVANFARQGDAADTIAKTQLGLAPRIVTGAPGAVAGSAQLAGSASYGSTFAEAPAGSGIGATSLDAELTFVAPQGKAAGTYESVLTLTVISK